MSDILAKLQEAIGQPVVVENKTGAGGNIGADFVAEADKDGHTLLLIDVSTLAISPSLQPCSFPRFAANGRSCRIDGGGMGEAGARKTPNAAAHCRGDGMHPPNSAFGFKI